MNNFNFAIFGNPIKHSKSPQIHTLFSYETGIKCNYGRILASKDNFEQIIKNFFSTNGLGANITMPFKIQAFKLCDYLTDRAIIAGAVNTLKKQLNGSLLGDNTDGIGLISDLQRLNFLQNNIKILLIGAGGAARGVISPLLTSNYQLILTNRTFSRARELVNLYSDIGKISAIPLDKLSTINYNLIINATTTSVYNEIPALPESIITSEVSCYDMFYQDKDTPFISWCRHHGANKFADGLGMLVGQAAHSFLLWHGVLPPITPILRKLR